MKSRISSNPRPFNVIIEDNGRFRPYDIMRYLVDAWSKLKSSRSRYAKAPQTKKELGEWINSQMKYMYWGRCEYEMVLTSWPSGRAEKKIDIYEQYKMNESIVLDVFINNINFVE